MMKTSEQQQEQQHNECDNNHNDDDIFNFLDATKLLRKSRSELDVKLIDNGKEVVTTFFTLLEKVEAYKYKQLLDLASVGSGSGGSKRKRQHQKKKKKKFLIEVEGLDGSGKTTLVQKLQHHYFPNAVAVKTPSVSLHKIRPLWDKKGGTVA